MTHRTLLTLSDVINRHEALSDGGFPCITPAISPDCASDLPFSEIISQSFGKAQRHWTAAIAALESLLVSALQSLPETDGKGQGLILSGIAPIFSHPLVVSRFQVGVFTPEAWHNLSLMRLQLPSAGVEEVSLPPLGLLELPLFPKDPIAQEQFCLVLSEKFGLLMVLGQNHSELPAFSYSFDPVVVEQGWKILRSRLELTAHPHLTELDRQFAAFAPPTPDYRWVMNFGRLMLQLMPLEAPVGDRKARATTVSKAKLPLGVDAPLENLANGQGRSLSPDVELLQALTHEIRTPLTTIRTMTRLLLRHKSLTPDMIKRLGIIDQECSDQIDRMELILRATELQTASLREKPVQLVPTSLEQVFEQGIPRWKRQAQRRNVDLDILMPPKLPQVVSDPAMLDQILTGLLEKFTRSLTQGGQIRVQVSTAGHQLKLQLHTQSTTADNAFKALGQLLLFQPATGSLSLNLDTTKHLCHALGGKLIVRQRSRQGEVITIFLPLGNTSKGKSDSKRL